MGKKLWIWIKILAAIAIGCVILAMIALGIILQGLRKPSRYSEQYYLEIRTRADEQLFKAMEADLGLRKGDYEIIKTDVNTGTNSSHPITTYQFQAENKIYRAVVDDVDQAVYSDYYSEQFHEVLFSYLIEKIGKIKELESMNYEITSVGFVPEPISIFSSQHVDETIPTWATPERFEEYLEQCEKKPAFSLDVNVSANWYCVTRGLPPDDMLLLMNKATGIHVQSLNLYRFVKWDDTDLTPADQKDEYWYYSNMKPRHDYCENVTIGDDIVVTKLHYDDGEHVVKDSGFTAELDADGVLHVTPGDQKYRIYYRSEGAGVEVRFAEQEDTSTEDFSRRDMVKLDRVPSWWVEDDVPGWKILLEEGK